MGLFTKKELCPICGGEVKGLFPRKIEGHPVCKICYGEVDLPQETLDHMTVEEFKGYMHFREENIQLKQQFKTTRQVDFGWLDDKFLFDMEHRLLCMNKKLKGTVFEGGQITSFEIGEDQMPLFKGSAKGLIRYTSTLPQRVMAMAPQIEQLKLQIQIRREMEYRQEHNQENNNDYRYSQMPMIEMPEPFQRFEVTIHFEHPYRTLYTAYKSAPVFDPNTPSINDYLETYNSDVRLMEDLARALMEVAFPGAPERTAAAVAMTDSGNGQASGTMVDMAEELQRLKDLMDQGILSEEEFTAKKRQMLGISL